MELIAASRIGKARALAQKAAPYDLSITRAVAAVASHVDLDHPLTSERTDTNRVAVLVITSDRGMAGAYSATILRESEKLFEELQEEGKEPVVYACGRRANAYFRFRHRELAAAWEGESDSPTPALTKEIGDRMLADFLAPVDQGGVSGLYVVYTRFKTLVSQVPQVRRMLPLEVVDMEHASEETLNSLDTSRSSTDLLPLYEFEPSAEEVLDSLLPLYVSSRIRNALLQSAASELASRQQAMHTATDNAEELIRTYTRLANAARQAEITQEISEIVSGADALAAG